MWPLTMWQLCPWAGAAAENAAIIKQNARSRRVNVYGAYVVIDDSALWDKTVLLIDDVKTTGATLNECAKMLRMHGAKAVYAATVAIA